MGVQHVKTQISLLKCDEYKAAFLLNSPANRKRLVSADKFEAIVSGGTSFKVLTLPQISYVFREGEKCGDVSTVKVDARPDSGDTPLSFLFDLRRSEGDERWETDGVRIEC